MMLRVFFVSLTAFLLSGCYVLKLAYEQTALIVSRDDISDVLAAADTDTGTKKKLTRVNDILRFASQAGLNVEDAYNTYIKVDRDAISYVVFAAPADKLELVQWWYPVVGDLPYRGYFSVAERDAKAKELVAQGYDIAKSDVDAYSSLGWFSDPVYSTMLTRRVSSLAHLLFHELVHRTYWLKDHSDFNESIAEFVADLLTTAYLQKQGNKKELEHRKHYWADRKKYLIWLTDLRTQLQEVYAQHENIEQRKAETFANFLANKPKFKAVDFIGNKEWNNARVMVAKMYNFDLEKYRQVYACLLAKENFKNAGNFLLYLEKNITGEKPQEKFYRLCE